MRFIGKVGTLSDKKSTRLIFFIVGCLFVTVLLVCILYWSLIAGYRNRNLQESSTHLMEVARQVKLYIESEIDRNWETAYSLSNSVSLLPDDYSDEADLKTALTNERNIWKLTDIVLYTEDGYALNTSDSIIANDVASNIVYNVEQYSEYTSIIRSTVTYSIPVDCELMLNGSQVVALSIVQDLSSFVDNMAFESFGGAAFLYLTQADGTIVSKLNTENAVEAYNIMTYVEQYDLVCFKAGPHDIMDMLRSPGPITHIIKRDSGDEYLVTMPIRAHDQQMRLFYSVPESIVNRTTSGFSSYVTTLSASVIMLFAAAAVLVFLLIYRNRKLRFDNAIIARERMFNLLTTNTHTAFTLLSVKQELPLYVSANTEQIIGHKYLVMEKRNGVYKLIAKDDRDVESIAKINTELKEWDGVGEFVSSYIPYVINGEERYFVLRIYQVESDPNEFVGIAQDISRERDRENVLRSALELADSASKAKTNFLANMSHDIRTPMNAVVNMTDFAIESIGKPVQQLEYLNTIRESSQHLLRLINNILDTSSVESGKMVIGHEPFDLQQCLREVCDVAKPLHIAKKQNFVADFSKLSATRLLGDKLKLSQVFLNLLTNAIKFTDEGGHIRFTAEEMPGLRPQTAAYRFSVEDDGIGISDDMQPHIFEAFVRADKRANKTEGTGLGLSICKSFVTIMGGTIYCVSREGEGSCFIVELSFDRAPEVRAEPKAEADALPSFAGKRALICEDNDINRIIARKILIKLGFTVEYAVNGKEGYDMFMAAPPDYYDIIYMDILMPVMDGYAATAAIRQSEHPRAKTIPILAMTANVFTEDVEKSRAHGMNYHIGKPLVITDIVVATKKSLPE